jgi:S-methylmethionine-dependent homocysteine/selenocysteine methylase
MAQSDPAAMAQSDPAAMAQSDPAAMAQSELAARLLAAHERRAPPLVLDGALGTELELRGVASSLPLWSARALFAAPEAVLEIHRDHVVAGAELLTANTFRTRRRTLAREGLGARAPELTALAVRLAARAAAGAPRRVFVAGSAAPLEDCYRPDLVPDAEALAREHAEHAEQLAAAGADCILAETMNCAREAAAAARAARATGLPLLSSFVCGADARLLSGEPLEEGLAAVAPSAPLAVGVNCLPAESLAPCLAVLDASGLPFFVYPNLGSPDPVRGFAPLDDRAPADFARFAREWIAAGACLVGGCCGTRPAHVRALAELVEAAARPS